MYGLNIYLWTQKYSSGLKTIFTDLKVYLWTKIYIYGRKNKGSLTLAMGKCLWFSVKIKVCQSSLSSP